jgi:O-antigen/teichoic acid export membrane protein
MSIRRNSIYNLAGSLAPTVVAIITVPLYLRLIGVDRYGVLALVWVFLGYFGVFDLGLSRATAQLIAKLRQAEPSERANAFWTALMLNSAFGVVGGLLFWPVARIYFATYFQVAEPLRLEILAAVPWLAAAVPVATISGVLCGALQGREQFLALNVSSTLGSLLYQLLPLVVAWLHGPDLAWLVLASLIGRVLIFVIMFDQCYRHVPLKGAPLVSRGLIPMLFRYGGWVTVTSLVSPLMVVLDRFVIGALTGAKAVTYYTVPYNLAIRVMVIPTSLTAALFPRFAAAEGEENDRIFGEAVQVLLVVVTPLIIVGLIIMNPFLSWWVGPKFAENAAVVGQILLLGLWANCFSFIPYTLFQAQGRPDLVAKCHLAELLPYMVILYFSLSQWGIAGAAMAWTVRVAMDCILLFALSELPLKVYCSFIIPAMLLGLTAFFVFNLPAGSMFVWFTGVALFLFSLFWAWRFLPPSLGAYLPESLRGLALKRG